MPPNHVSKDKLDHYHHKSRLTMIDNGYMEDSTGFKIQKN